MDLSGLFAVVPTVFHDDGTLDLDGQGAVVEAYASAGVAGVTVLGVMGEAPLLDQEEQGRVVVRTSQAAGGLPVVVGLGPPGPDQVMAARRAAELGASAVLAGLSPGNLDQRASRLASIAVAGAPVIAQHHPASTGVVVPIDEVVRLVTTGDVVGLKAESPPTPDLVEAVVAADGPPALGGLSALYLIEELEAGSSGAMTGVAVPELLADVIGRFHTGDRSAARDVYSRATAYLRLEAMPGTAGLVARKEAWRQRGVISSSRVRKGAPLGSATKQAITRRLQDCEIDVADRYPGA